MTNALRNINFYARDLLLQINGDAELLRKYFPEGMKASDNESSLRMLLLENGRLKLTGS
jgi:hypothetical protein